jgi:hypothetical protein
MKRILILVAVSLLLCATASAFQGGGGESTKKKEDPKKNSGTKPNNTTPARPPARPAPSPNRPADAEPSQREIVIDYANVIDADTRKKLESIYINLKQHSGIEFAVVTVDSTGGQDIFDYSLAEARRRGIGSKAGGFLFLVAIKDRKYFTQVSDRLEADLSNELAGQIQRERLVPQFRKANYSQGIYDTVQAYVATLAAKRGFIIKGIDQR